MVVVKIELHSANTGEITEIGKMIIANDGTETSPNKGNYIVKLARKNITNLDKIWDKPQREARVEGYNRISDSVWVLVSKALTQLGFK
jgi:hypothetical protein